MPVDFRAQLITSQQPHQGAGTRPPILLIYDDRLAPLAPLDDLRPTFAVRTGALTTAERLAASINHAALILDPGPSHFNLTHHDLTKTSAHHLLALPSDYTAAATRAGITDPSHPVLAINSRCVLPIDELSTLPPASILVEHHAAKPTPPTVIAIHDTLANIASHITGLRERNALPKLTAHSAPSNTLLTRPWHWRRSRNEAINQDLAILADHLTTKNLATTSNPQDVRIIQTPPNTITSTTKHTVTIAATAALWPGVTIDATLGPVLIDEHATIRPGATIIGPAYIGQHTTVIDNALIKPHTAIGPVCKVAGEIGGTIIQAYSNKAHDGHLGDSYLGEWVNLGAGTTNSNLLNTYTQVIAQIQPSASKERTGEIYLGCTLADHVKTAIATRIMTGAIAHTGTMWAATHPLAGTIPAFRWITDTTGPQGQPFRSDKFIETARTVMARRNIQPSEPYLDLLRQLEK